MLIWVQGTCHVRDKYPTKLPLKPLPWLRRSKVWLLLCVLSQFKLRAKHMALSLKGSLTLDGMIG